MSTEKCKALGAAYSHSRPAAAEIRQKRLGGEIRSASGRDYSLSFGFRVWGLRVLGLVVKRVSGSGRD